VVARVSSHILRLEREFQQAKHVVSNSDPQAEHFVRPIDLVRLPARHGSHALVVSIFEAPGPNYLRELVEFGPNAYQGIAGRDARNIEAVPAKSGGQIPLMMFLDFAIGAAECCEILHHGNRMVHGEIRGDAFHFNSKTGAVKMLNFGSGVRSFENGLTSAGWYSLSREVGVEHKLQFIAPEQTGRVPAGPDSRTDIYSLGVLFWMMLTGEPAFEGDTPLLIMQNVLSRRIPSASSKRMDIPEILSAIIAKMTQKNIEDRYKSTSGLKRDLVRVQKMLCEGNLDGLRTFRLAEKDVSAFFSLPTYQIGREKEKKIITDLIDTVSKKLSRRGLHNKLISVSSNSSKSGEYNTANDDAVSDSTSSRGSQEKIVNGVPLPAMLTGSKRPSQQSQESIVESEPASTEEFRHVHGLDSRSISRSGDSRNGFSSTQSSAETANKLLINSSKYRRKGRCEVVAISGAAGLGKSCLVQSIQIAARSHGYFASAKFDQARKSPFEPVLRLLSSLFRQIFSESDVSTPFHDLVRQHVKPVWPFLHERLELPGWLLDAVSHADAKESPMSLRAVDAHRRRASSPLVNNLHPGTAAADWLRSGGSTKSSRFQNVFLNVLAVLAQAKFICFSIDDLQFADSESLELIRNIVVGRIPMLLILTCRQDDVLPKAVRYLLRSAHQIELKPFTEDETADYVSVALHRDKNDVMPLVAVLQERTAGNPFFLREMLEACYRNKCIFYSWRASIWEWDLNRVFAEFESQGSRINNDFVTKRLQELPHVARSLLAWASLIGTSFSFSLIKRLMAGENAWALTQDMPIVREDPVVGLQACLQSYILTSREDEDRFRFSHDRYMQASASLTECFNKMEMHFSICKTMMQVDYRDYTMANSKALYVKSQHICAAVSLLKEREQRRSVYRDILFQAAEAAEESGARNTGLFYLTHCLTLLQSDPWNESNPDVSYDETLSVFTRTAENYWYLGYVDAALNLTTEVFEHAKNAVDSAPCFIIRSRVYAMQGDSQSAFATLKRCLTGLGLDLPDTTWDESDKEYWRVVNLLKEVDRRELVMKVDMSPGIEVLGPVLVELVSAAFWTDSLLFYQISMIMIRLHVERGAYRQSSLGFLHFASIAVSRFDMTEFGCEIAALAKQLFETHSSDSYTVGRGQTLHAFFIGPLETHIRDQIPVLNRAWDATIAACDRILSLLNIGIISAFRVWASCDLGEIEAWVHESTVEFPNWQSDLRGGVFLTSVCQYTRALQGKTNYRNAELVLDDDQHRRAHYLKFIRTTASNTERPMTIYLSYYLVILFSFGHLEEAIDVGEQLLGLSPNVFSARYHYSNLFYLSLALLAKMRKDPRSANRQALLERILKFTAKIRSASLVNDINYKAWLLLLGAEISDINEDYGRAVQLYEESLDHCESNEFILDSALILELYGESLIRRGARRPARRILTECISTYRSVSAYGKAEQVSEKYDSLLRTGPASGTADASCQTAVVEMKNTAYVLQQNEDRANEDLGAETSADRTQAWVTPGMNRPQSIALLEDGAYAHKEHGKGLESEFSALGLDMIGT
jgi:serine/threonine protein kinase/tetratricopeptide (TPR) repeat protein